MRWIKNLPGAIEWFWWMLRAPIVEVALPSGQFMEPKRIAFRVNRADMVRKKHDALGEYVPQPSWRNEGTPAFEAQAAEWLLGGRDIPESVALLIRVPAGAIDALSRAAVRGLPKKRGKVPNLYSEPGTSKPRHSSGKRSGNPAKRAAVSPPTAVHVAGTSLLGEAMKRAAEAELEKERERRRNGL